MKAVILCGSPRRDGNSSLLAQSAAEGLRTAGAEAQTVFADEVVGGFLRDCRQCRDALGRCAIQDGFEGFLRDHLLPCDGLIVATPIYWYGMSAQLKAVFDRIFCHAAASSPTGEAVVARLQGKRIGALIASEETFPTAPAGILHQLQEYSRYTNSDFVGWVHGVGNARGDVRRDPKAPLADAVRFGETFFTARSTDYKITTPRAPRVWADAG